MGNSPITVYWAPVYEFGGIDWNILYSEPAQLYKDLYEDRSSIPTKESFFSCPAMSSRLRNTYVFKNTVETHYRFDDENAVSLSDSFINMSISRKSSIKNSLHVAMHLSWIFFTEEESLLFHINPPFFSKALHMNYGVFPPGGFDIGKWFRPTSTEFRLWEGVDEFYIQENEPMFYAEFISDRPVHLKRFVFNEKLERLAQASVKSPQFMGQFRPLKERYDKFLQSRNKEIILKEIKSNLL